jgi:pimeloyl-ACP methyl ester carboxylesterase
MLASSPFAGQANRLLNERIPNHDLITGEVGPTRWIYVLHGIFGAGRNWATVARRLVAARPDWGSLLVDLRQHGASQGFAPPHTLASSAADLDRLADATQMPASAVLGHSFGGKVALQWAATRPSGLQQVWVIDSTPEAGAPRGSAWQMLGVVQSLPESFESRTAGIDALVRNGVARPVADWMATNLIRDGDRLKWRFDTVSLERLLRDFFDTDLWSVVEAPPPGMSIHFVRASESSVLSPHAIARIQAAEANGSTALHTLDGGHWLNADNPDGIVELLARFLPAGPPARGSGSSANGSTTAGSFSP